MKTNLEWKTPKLICLKTSDLICKIKARANSGCSTDVSTEGACDSNPEAYFCNSNIESLEGEVIQCGVLSNCIEGSGIALGCNDNHYSNVSKRCNVR